MFVQPIAQLALQGIWCHLQGVWEISVRLWLSVIIRWIGVFPEGELGLKVAVIYNWKRPLVPADPALTHGSQLHCFAQKSVLELDEHVFAFLQLFKHLLAQLWSLLAVRCGRACLGLILPDNRATGCCVFNQPCRSPRRAPCHVSTPNTICCPLFVRRLFTPLNDAWWSHIGNQLLEHNYTWHGGH